MIRVRNLRKTFKTRSEGVTALKDIGFEVEPGSFFTLLGPSGCGKTTTLRCIAGLDRPDAGEISVSDKLMYSSFNKVFVPPSRRDIGMVFQSYAIWPHMTVFQNVSYPLRARGEARSAIEEKVSSVLRSVGLEGLEDRLAPRLSGGQQQRVALARALVANPTVLLLDEPLSNLDAKLRKQMRWELKDLQSRLGTTTLYVTHDQVEALAISDQIALMNKGSIVQLGTPLEMYRNPINEFAANFIGDANLVPGVIEGDGANGSVRVSTGLGEFWATQRGTRSNGKDVVLAFRPEEVLVAPAGAKRDRCNLLQGRIEQVTYLGDNAEVRVQVGSRRIQVKGDREFAMAKGEAVFLQIPVEDCLAIRPGET